MKKYFIEEMVTADAKSLEDIGYLQSEDVEKLTSVKCDYVGIINKIPVNNGSYGGHTDCNGLKPRERYLQISLFDKADEKMVPHRKARIKLKEVYRGKSQIYPSTDPYLNRKRQHLKLKIDPYCIPDEIS